MNFKKLIKTLKRSKKPLLAVLIDPDKFNPELIRLADKVGVDCFLAGGSRLDNGDITKTILGIRKITKIPVVLFPGDETQLSKEADGLFLPSLLSGRNTDYLIGKQIIMAPLIKKMKLHSIPMAYLLIDGKKASATQKVTKTKPLNPSDIPYIINTALAAEQLGFKLIYLEAGSGARYSVPGRIIREVKKSVSIPLIVGGGIDSKERARQALDAGADMIVVGNALEKNVHLLTDIKSCFTRISPKIHKQKI
jgi:phosphoglycerol geranylgeranyltransferase